MQSSNMGPFIPVAKHAQTTVSRIEVADALPEHVGVFVKSFGPPKFSTESEFVSLVPGAAIEFAGVYHDRAELLIVSRTNAAPYPTAAALVEAVSAGKVPAVRRDFYSRETLPAWGPRDITLNYRVQAKASGPEIVRTSWDPLWQWYVAALLLCAAILGGGLWFVRRVFRRVRRTPAT